MNRIKEFIKKETTLCVAWLLAVISAFIVFPGKEYISYIDFRSLGILWGLMLITQGLKKENVFTKIGTLLLSKTKKLRQLEITLVFLCFFSSMFITNDVALITFVPFAIMMMEQCGERQLILPVVVLQTIAANLGSMLTPIGNPQNLYLYSLSEMKIFDFLILMLPYTSLSAAMLLVILYILPRGNMKINYETEECNNGSTKNIAIYLILFVFALLTVLHIVDYRVLIFIILAAVLVIDRDIIKRADYALLLTFIGFFIFTGNMGRIPAVIQILNRAINGREVEMGVLLSQCISNVPAALLISNFTANYQALIIVVNLGGLGTLIASMASLISFKQYTIAYPDHKSKYLGAFTLINILMLLILLLLHAII